MFPTEADLDRLEKQFSVCDDSAPDMQAIADRYNKHMPVLEQCYYSQHEPLLSVPEPVDIEDPYFIDHDRENIIKINKQLSVHQLPGALFGNYTIYGEGAPFERLFFQARDQLRQATKTIADERALRAYETYAEFDDFNFIDGYLEQRWQNSRLDADLSSARFQLGQLRARVKRLERSAERWRRKYEEAVGDEFVARPSSV
jgi:hypothetical protein